MSVEQTVQARRAPAEATTPTHGRVTAGVDWASEDHAIAVVDDQGRPVDRFSITHTGPELRRLVTRLRRWGVCEVAIERPDGPAHSSAG